MPKMALPAAFVPYSQDHVILDVGFDKELQTDLKQIPGVKWGPSIGGPKNWLVPIDLQHLTVKVLGDHGYELPIEWDRPRTHNVSYPLHPQGLFPWQIQGVELLRHENRGFLMFAPGTGKTAATILGAEPPIVWVCPAMSRWSVAREIKRVRPEVTSEVYTGGGADLRSDVVVCSYQGLSKIIEEGTHYPPRWFVIDEVHNIKNKKTDRSLAVRLAISDWDKPRIAELSGTPVPNKPHDLWNPLDILCPHRWGTEWQFQQRYSIIGHNGYGRTIGGLNPAHAEELSQRLSTIAVRATEEDAATQLPPMHLTVEWGEPHREWAGLDEDSLLSAAQQVKVEWARGLLAEDMELGVKPAIVVWHRRAAEVLGAALGIAHIHGGMSANQRDEMLTRLAEKGDPFVATMASIAEGLNQLANYSHVTLVELPYKWSIVVQAMKRFHRLNTRKPVHFRALAIPETIDEQIIANLLAKTQDINKLIRAGAVEGALENLVGRQDFDAMFDSWVETQVEDHR